jgi:hypothetical protein
MSKKVNPWVEHVKKYAKENGLSYMCAVEQAKASYNKPVKVGKRQMMKEKEEKKLEDFKRLGLTEDYDDLVKEILKREKKKEKREMNVNPFIKYSSEKIEKEIERLKEKLKDAKGDDEENIIFSIDKLRQASLLRGKIDKKNKFSKMSLEQLKDELEKRYLIVPDIDKDDEDKQKFVLGEIKMLESAIKTKKKKETEKK